jgi:hypothetical protein
MSSPTVSGGPKGDRAVETAADKLEAFVRGARKPRPRAPAGPQLARPKPAPAKRAASIGFVLAGGIGATMRYFARRGRNGQEKARAGRFALRDRD